MVDSIFLSTKYLICKVTLVILDTRINPYYVFNLRESNRFRGCL